jgi:subtilisin family serine protease
MDASKRAGDDMGISVSVFFTSVALVLFFAGLERMSYGGAQVLESVAEISDTDIRVEPLVLEFDYTAPLNTAGEIAAEGFQLQSISTKRFEGPKATTDLQYFFYYFKEKIPLQIDMKRIAVWEEGVGTTALQRDGAATSAVVSPGLPGWSVVTTNPTNAATTSVEQTRIVIRETVSSLGVKFASPFFLGPDNASVIILPRIIVGFKKSVSGERAEQVIAGLDAGRINRRNFANMERVFLLDAPTKSGLEVLQIANRLAELTEVRFAEPDMLFQGEALYEPNDPGFFQCWGIHNTGQQNGTPGMDMDGPEAWDVTTGDSAVTIVIIDNGIQQDHPDLNQRPGTDTTSEGPGDGGPVNQYDNHGTAVGGCVAAVIDNHTGVVGIAPDCKIASARAHISNPPPYIQVVSSWVVDALAWAESIGARVTNNSNSYGYLFGSSAITAKYEETRNNGMVHFAAAGNSYGGSLSYPANLPTVNAVAALERDGGIADFSSYGEGLAFSAPGRDIYTTDRTGTAGYAGGDYDFLNGTSFASPYAAGVAALVLSADGSLSAPEVEQILNDSCIDLGSPGYDTIYGHGFVNAYDAVTLAAKVQVFRIFNEGNDPLHVMDILPESGSPWLSFLPVPPFEVEPSGSQTINVFVDPKGLSSGLYNDRLLVLSNDSDESPYPDGVYVNLNVICDLPTINDEPDDVTVDEGQDAVFTVVATSARPITYQWRMNGADVGTDNPSFTLSNVQAADDGSEITCEVINACGAVFSATALLSVNLCLGDLDGDGDVDGLDRAHYTEGAGDITPEEFAAELGRDDCPVSPP